MYVINPGGRVVAITPEMWEELKDKGFKLIKNNYENMTYNELQKVAKPKGINTFRLRKSDIIDALVLGDYYGE